MATDFPLAFAGVLPIGQRTLVASGPAEGFAVAKELIVSNPGLAGRRPHVPTTVFGVAAGPAGRMFYAIGTGTACAIVEVSSDARPGAANVRIVAGSLASAGTTDSTDPLAARFSSAVMGLVYNPTDNRLYIADSNNNKVRWMNLSTYQVGTLAGSGVAGQADGTGASATLSAPRALALNPAGTILYVGQTAATPAVSLRAITLPGAVVSTLANSALAQTTSSCDSLSVSQDGAWLWYLERTPGSFAELNRYSIAGSTTLAILNGGTFTAGTQAAAEVTTPTAIGATSNGALLTGSGALGTGGGQGSVCADPNDNLACFIVEASNTVGSSNYVRRVQLMGGTAASPTHWTSHFFAGDGASAGSTRGNGIAGTGSLITATLCMATAPMDKSVLIVAGGASGALLSMDTQTGFLSEIIGGSTPLGVNGPSGQSGVGHDGYFSLLLLDAADAITPGGPNWSQRDIYDRMVVAPGASVALNQNLSLPPGKKLVALAHNVPLFITVSTLTGIDA